MVIASCPGRALRCTTALLIIPAPATALLPTAAATHVMPAAHAAFLAACGVPPCPPWVYSAEISACSTTRHAVEGTDGPTPADDRARDCGLHCVSGGGGCVHSPCSADVAGCVRRIGRNLLDDATCGGLGSAPGGSTTVVYCGAGATACNPTYYYSCRSLVRCYLPASAIRRCSTDNPCDGGGSCVGATNLGAPPMDLVRDPPVTADEVTVAHHGPLPGGPSAEPDHAPFTPVVGAVRPVAAYGAGPHGYGAFVEDGRTPTLPVSEFPQVVRAAGALAWRAALGG